MKRKVFGESVNLAKFSSKQKTKVDSDDEDFEVSSSDHFCGYFIEQQPITKITVPIDKEVRDPSYYRLVANKISELSEGDVIEFRIHSPGGQLAGLVTLLHAVRTTEADTVAVVEGDAYSAASLLALACDVVIVGPYANFLCHSASLGTRGKATDVLSQVTHTKDYAEKIFRECYEYFLTEKEIEDVLAGKEMYLDYKQINERLERKYSILKGMQENGCCGDPDNCEDICSCPCAVDED